MLPIHEPQAGVYRAQKWISEARPISGYGAGGQITVSVRFDDECKNGHQTFSITADVYTTASRRRHDCQACGCLHDDIAAIFPELAPLIKWHLTSTDGPMHYVANTCHHAGDRIPRDLAAARSCAVWPEATDEQLCAPREELEAALTARLPGLIAAFRADMTAAGLLWEPGA
jgi:uncharacterized protein Usg